jgi:hypothetical protein
MVPAISRELPSLAAGQKLPASSRYAELVIYISYFTRERDVGKRICSFPRPKVGNSLHDIT